MITIGNSQFTDEELVLAYEEAAKNFGAYGGTEDYDAMNTLRRIILRKLKDERDQKAEVEC